MSEPVDTPADQRPSPAPSSGEAANPESKGRAERSDGAQDSDVGQSTGQPRRNRRRGSRGGRGRKPGGGGGANAASSDAKEAATASDDGDPRPDLPDRPGEGRASPD